jgi:hypothetical protein
LIREIRVKDLGRFSRRSWRFADVKEIIFEVQEDEADGGYVAALQGHSIATQGDTLEGLRRMVRDAVHCHFGDAEAGEMPSVIRLHFVRDEVLFRPVLSDY